MSRANGTKPSTPSPVANSCKWLMRSFIGICRKSPMNACGSSSRRVTRDDLRRWREAAEGFAPRRMALLTGFPRSGTTLLEQVLDAHPDVVSSEERDFIGRELFLTVVGRRVNTPLLELLNDLRVPQIEADRKRYFLAMEYILGAIRGRRMHLDKNPAYNLTIPQVLRFFPETRLIVALRDPRDVVLSCYLRYLPLNAVAVRFSGHPANRRAIRAGHGGMVETPRTGRRTVVRSTLRRHRGRPRRTGATRPGDAGSPVERRRPQLPAAAVGHGEASHQPHL